ncbi:MAG: hypothetical protein AB199_03815 [Parcubacteria bacterium C7867-004]|nr:MAG: hypothetical protein AB199_03815 [Parcubacteria bacterium C7867-004]
MAGTPQDYPYRICGLSVILVGFTGMHEDGDVTIHRINRLHSLIARDVALRNGWLRGEEVEFLRHYLGLTYTEFYQLLSRGSVDNPEIFDKSHGRSELLETSEVLLRRRVLMQVQLDSIPTKEETFAMIRGFRGNPPTLQIDASHPENYRVIEAVAA